jgi:hypothetical protein
MKSKTKVALAGLGALLTLGWLASRTRVKAAPPGGVGANLSLAVYDPGGNLVPANSPVTLQLGVTYTIRATVTNTSTQGGAPVGVSLRTWLGFYDVQAPGYLGYLERTESFGPGETRVFQFSYTPGGWGEYPGLTGNFIEAWVTPWDSGLKLASAQDVVSYAPSPIQYGAALQLGAF